MRESVQANNNLASTRKSISCSNGILTQNLSVTLPVLSTLNKRTANPIGIRNARTFNPCCGCHKR